MKWESILENKTTVGGFTYKLRSIVKCNSLGCTQMLILFVNQTEDQSKIGTISIIFFAMMNIEFQHTVKITPFLTLIKTETFWYPASTLNLGKVIITSPRMYFESKLW